MNHRQKQKPCPVHVPTKDGLRYCEQGAAGHAGTCVGNRSEAEYRRLLALGRVR